MFHVFCSHIGISFGTWTQFHFSCHHQLSLFFVAPPRALISSLLGSLFCIRARCWLYKDQQQHSTSSQKSPCCALEWLMTCISRVSRVAFLMTSDEDHLWHTHDSTAWPYSVLHTVYNNVIQIVPSAFGCVILMPIDPLDTHLCSCGLDRPRQPNLSNDLMEEIYSFFLFALNLALESTTVDAIFVSSDSTSCPYLILRHSLVHFIILLLQKRNGASWPPMSKSFALFAPASHDCTCWLLMVVSVRTLLLMDIQQTVFERMLTDNVFGVACQNLPTIL